MTALSPFALAVLLLLPALVSQAADGAVGPRKALRVGGRVYLVMPEAMRRALVASADAAAALAAPARINGLEVAPSPASLKTPYNVMRTVDAAGRQSETIMDEEAKAAARTMGLPKGRNGYPGRVLLRLELAEEVGEVKVDLPGEASPLVFRVAPRKP